MMLTDELKIFDGDWISSFLSLGSALLLFFFLTLEELLSISRSIAHKSSSKASKSTSGASKSKYKTVFQNQYFKNSIVK